MKSLKKIIVLLLFFIAVIIIILVANIINQNNLINKNINQEIITQGGRSTVNSFMKKTKIDSLQMYFQLDYCINQYIEYINNENSKAIKAIFLDDFSEQTYINDIADIKGTNDFLNTKFIIRDIYSIESNYERPYFIKGVLLKNKHIENRFFIVIIDFNNSTYSIKEIFEDEYATFKDEEIQFYEKNIEKNDYNVISQTYYSKEDIVKKYFYDYIENVVYYPIYAYQTLNETYSKKRFDDYDEYRNYLKVNIENYKLMEQNRIKQQSDFKSEEEYNKYLQDKYYAGLKKYQINQMENYEQYICIDFNDNYYTFNVLPDFTYNVILDTYTIDFPQFIEKYNSSDIQGRVAMNIDRFIKALNAKDYKYAYNCLPDNFKENKFKNLSIFEKYIKENIFDNNIVEYEKFKNEGDIYIYDIKLKNSNNENESRKMQIIMKLGDGTNFVMSFNIN